jgi:hypothetical protein
MIRRLFIITSCIVLTAGFVGGLKTTHGCGNFEVTVNLHRGSAQITSVRYFTVVSHDQLHEYSDQAASLEDDLQLAERVSDSAVKINVPCSHIESFYGLYRQDVQARYALLVVRRADGSRVVTTASIPTAGSANRVIALNK